MNEEEEESEEEDDDGFSGQKKKEEVEEDPVERKTQQFNSDFLLVVESLMAMDPVKSEVWLWFKGRREKGGFERENTNIYFSVLLKSLALQQYLDDQTSPLPNVPYFESMIHKSLRGESPGREAAERCQGDGAGEVCSSVRLFQGVSSSLKLFQGDESQNLNNDIWFKNSDLYLIPLPIKTSSCDSWI